VPRILVLDDEPLISALIGDWLNELHCEMIGPAVSVQSALDLIDATSLDGAIIDVSLRGEESYAVAEALRKRGVPFAFTTGYNRSGVAVRFADALILPKPFSFNEVETTIVKFRESCQN
jgi:DNA-binding response OmpR family regulator